MMVAAGGGMANVAGRSLEQSVESIVRQKYRKISAESFTNSWISSGTPIFASQFTIGKNIYNKNRRVDFILFHPNLWPDRLIIQCKWQASQGTVEEKYPFEVECINKDMIQTIIVLDGGGYSKGAEQWLRSQSGNGYLKHVFDLGQFQRFASKGKL